MFFIYIIQNLINNKLYIGKTNNLKRRWKEHKKVAQGGKEKYKKDFRAIHAALAKYKINNFSYFSIEAHSDELDAYDAEAFWIEFFRSNYRYTGYNETPGGKGMLSGSKHPYFGKHPSEETRKKLSAAQRGRKPHNLGKTASSELRKKFSEMRKGSKNSMYGKHHTEESRQLISSVKVANGKVKGEKHYLATFTNIQAEEIRLLFSQGKTRAEIAKIYNARWLTIHRIVKNKTY